MSKEIPLTQGKVAIVDDADFDWLNQWKWCAEKHGDLWYASRKEGFRTIFMHRQILGLTLGDKNHSDHRDHNGLNNWHENLRICKQNQNQWNSRRRKDNSSGHKGVWWQKSNHKWAVKIRVNGKRYSFHGFTSKLEAAKVYDEMARKYFGEFACTNF